MDLSELIRQGTSHPLFLAAIGLVLGAIHGLEPGHSKTMMAAFIIAVRGTVAQAVLLGLSAALSHTAIVWLVALGALTLKSEGDGHHHEPVFSLVSGVIILLMAAWMAGTSPAAGKTGRTRSPFARKTPDTRMSTGSNIIIRTSMTTTPPRTSGKSKPASRMGGQRRGRFLSSA